MSHLSQSDAQTDVDGTRRRAQESALLLQGPPLNDVKDYIRALMNLEYARLATTDSDLHVRRAQGALQAYQGVLDVFEHVPVQYRRATSRKVV